MDNPQTSNKAPEQKGVQNNNDEVTPGPPTEGSKTSESAKSVSGNRTDTGKATASKSKKLNQSQSKETEQKRESKIKNKGATNKTRVSSGNTVTPRDRDEKKSQQGKKKHECHKALLLSWEVCWNPVGMAACLTNDNKISDCSYVALSHPTKDTEWTPLVDQSSIVIFYSSPNSEKPLYQMGRYLDYCSSKKGPKKVIVVIGEGEKKEWMAKWEEKQFSKTLQQFRFSRAELDWITRQDIIKEMLVKIEKMRKSLIGPTGEVEQVSQMTKQMKQDKQDKTKKQQSNTQDKDKKTKKQQSQKENPLNNKTQLEAQEQKSREEMKQTVPIVSWSPKADSDWLQTLLRSPYFRDTVKDVETINVTGSDLEKIAEQTLSVNTCILYYSKESLKLFGSQLHSSVKLLSTFEKKNIIVVIDNLDNKSTEKEATKLYNELPISSLSKHLFLFGKMEKEMDYLTHLTMNQQATQEAVKKWNTLQNLTNEKIEGLDPPPEPFTIGIFSRSAKDDYDWLEKLLKSPQFQVFVTDVRPFYISNKGYDDFYKAVTNCTFGILYHTKNRGRVNLTDVTDSLYDMEIEHMSSVLGQYKVLVVIDDLKESGAEEKERILYTQRSILKYSRNLLLVTPEEKTDEGKLLSKLMEVFASPAMDEPEILKGAYKETENSEGVKEVAKGDISSDTGKTTTGESTNDPNKEINKEKAAIGNNTNNSVKVNQKNAKGATTSIGEKSTTSVLEKDTKDSVGEKDTNNSAREKDTKNSAREKDTKNSAGEKDTKNSAGEKDTKDSVGEKDTKDSVGEKDTKDSAREKDTKDSGGDNDTKHLKGGNNSNNSAKENDLNSATKNFTKKVSKEHDNKNVDRGSNTKNVDSVNNTMNLDKGNEDTNSNKQTKTNTEKENNLQNRAKKNDEPDVEDESLVIVMSEQL